MRLRMLLSAVVGSTVLLGLGACTSSVVGTATYGGPTQTTEPSTEDRTTEDRTTEDRTTEDSPSGDPNEVLACITVFFAYDTANDNFVALAEATTNGTPTTLTPESVAVDFDAAIAAVQPSLDPLPPGAVRDAIQAAQNAAAGMRDALRAGSSVNNTDLNNALDSIATACNF